MMDYSLVVLFGDLTVWFRMICTGATFPVSFAVSSKTMNKHLTSQITICLFHFCLTTKGKFGQKLQ